MCDTPQRCTDGGQNKTQFLVYQCVMSRMDFDAVTLNPRTAIVAPLVPAEGSKGMEIIMYTIKPVGIVKLFLPCVLALAVLAIPAFAAEPAAKTDGLIRSAKSGPWSAAD